MGGKAGLGWGAGHRENVYAASRDCDIGTRRPSTLEAFCEGLEGATQRFIIELPYSILNTL